MVAANILIVATQVSEDRPLVLYLYKNIKQLYDLTHAIYAISYMGNTRTNILKK